MELDDRTKKVLKDVLNKSPMYRHMQMQVVDAGDGRSKLVMRAGEELHSLYGMLHGGAAATILDSACGIAIGSLLDEGEMCVTVDLRINYISNMKEGTLIGEGRVIHRGRQTGVAQAEIRDDKDNLIAVGMSTQLICRPDDLRMAEYPETGK
jgi:uncharacterized protein (TIGR00369 family)